MNTIFCSECGKELPEEASFCPYCLTKLIEVKDGEKPVKKKKKSIVQRLMIIATILNILGILSFTLLGIMITNSVDQSSGNFSSLDKYIGLWCDENSSPDEISKNGGNILEIVAVKNRVIRFNLLTELEKSLGEVYKDVICEVNNNKTSFYFNKDDKTYSGTIELKGDKIKLELYFSVFGDILDFPKQYCLKRADEYAIDLADGDYLVGGYTNFIEKTGLILDEVDIDDYSNKSYSNVDNNSMKVISSYSDPYRLDEITFPLLFVEADSSNKIQEVRISYDSLFKSNISYKGINGLSTFEDVYSKLGDPINRYYFDYSSNLPEDYEFGSYELEYEFEDETVTIYFEKMNLNYISIIRKDK